MVNIKQKVKDIRKEIFELDNLKKSKEQEIKDWYAKCNHDFKPIYTGHKINIYICNLCGYEEERMK